MRIVCTKSNLVKGVSIVSKAVPSKTTMPILECILVDASTDVIKLTANDMELGIETRIEGDILERGIIALNAKIFSEIVRKLPDSDVVIETTSDNQTLITCEKAKFNIAAQSGEDFSYLPVIEKEDYITVSEFTLKEVIRQTIFSIADNDTNKMMTGELFEIEGNSEIVRKLPDSDVVIETTSDNQTLITCEKAKFNIAAQSGEDFSYLPVI